jgi:hypothetical protein
MRPAIRLRSRFDQVRQFLMAAAHDRQFIKGIAGRWFIGNSRRLPTTTRDLDSAPGLGGGLCPRIGGWEVADLVPDRGVDPPPDWGVENVFDLRDLQLRRP